MNVFQTQFGTGQVLQATGVLNPTLQSWLKRGVIVAQRPEQEIAGGGSPGLHRRFSFFNVMEIAIAKALIDVGLGDVGNAFSAARHFAHTGGGGLGHRPARLPSLPFNEEGGSTLVAVFKDRSTECFHKVGCDPFPEIEFSLRTREGFVHINADEVFERVVPALGFDPRDVMTFAYASLA